MIQTPGILTYLIVCPLVFLGGFVDAVAGGGGLISLPAYMIAGLPVHNAIATNKLSSAMGTSIATTKLALAHYIPWKKALPCVIAALIGSNIGANLALLVSDALFKRIMLVVLPLTAFYIFRTRDLDKIRPELPPLKSALIATGIALVIGMYDDPAADGTRPLPPRRGKRRLQIHQPRYQCILSGRIPDERKSPPSAGLRRRALRHCRELHRRHLF